MYVLHRSHFVCSFCVDSNPRPTLKRRFLLHDMDRPDQHEKRFSISMAEHKIHKSKHNPPVQQQMGLAMNDPHHDLNKTSQNLPSIRS